MPFVDVNGTRLYYELKGAGPVVVFLHGWTLDTTMWDNQFDEFAKHYKVLRYDLRGYGKSAVPKMEHPYAHHEDLKALLDYLRIQKAAIIGLSMGGYAAINFAIMYPERASALIPADAYIERRIHSKEDYTSFAPIFSKAKEEGIESAREEWLNHRVFEPARRNPKCAGKLREIVGRYNGWNFINDVNEDLFIRLSPVQETRLHEIRAPTLIIVGELDVGCLEDADVLEEKIAGSEKVILMGVGHMSNMEDSVGFNKAVLGFLSRKIKSA
jgi:pimeloyl-ACP methyl ester carboxylesterase